MDSADINYLFEDNVLIILMQLLKVLGNARLMEEMTGHFIASLVG